MRKLAKKHFITITFTLILFAVIGYGLFTFPLMNRQQQANFGVLLIVVILCLVGAYVVLKTVSENREQKTEKTQTMDALKGKLVS